MTPPTNYYPDIFHSDRTPYFVFGTAKLAVKSLIVVLKLDLASMMLLGCRGSKNNCWRVGKELAEAAAQGNEALNSMPPDIGVQKQFVARQARRYLRRQHCLSTCV